MVVSTVDRSRDAINVRLPDTEGVTSMLNQCTTSLFGDARLPARFWAKVRVLDNGCWEWTASRISGYGQFARTLPRLAHRRAYECLVGPVPEGLELDHLCRNRACVNTDHLEPVTGSENVLRGYLSRLPKSHCPQGHPYSGSNLYVGPKGAQECRKCRRAHQQKHYRIHGRRRKR